MTTPLDKKRLLRKATIVCLSIIPAIVAMTITNALIAHVIVAKTLIFPKQTRKAQRVETVFVAPTSEDVDRVWKELDKSEPLPKIIAHDESRTAAKAEAEISELLSLVESRDSALSTLEETRQKALAAAKNEIAELFDAFTAHQERVEQDTSQDLSVITQEVIEYVEENDLLDLLSRHSFVDLDREKLEELFEMAMFEAEWLLDVDDDDEQSAVIRDALLLNMNGTLLASFGSPPTINGSLCEAFLVLDRNKVAEEFIPPPRRVVKKTKPKPEPVATSAIPADTARESDLYEIVHKIKDKLSRRDLSSIKLEDGESYPSPLDDEGTSMIVQVILPLVQSLKAKKQKILEEEQRIIQEWRDPAVELKPDHDKSIRVGCANSELVESLVTSGLEAIREKNELHAAWMSALHTFVTDPEALARMGTDIMKLQSSAIDYSERPDASKGRSSWKTGRKSVSYIADGPLLQRGLVRSVDWFVDAISGYNDNVDAVLDWIAGDSGLSLGTIIAESISRSLRIIPFPHEKVDRLKRSGILGGRARTMFEDPR